MTRYPLKPSVPFSLLCLLAACLLMLGGCSAIKVVETWSNPGKSGQRYQKLMILGIGHDENLRSMAENIMVEELQRNGVAAVASHTQIKEIDGVKRDVIVAAVRATGADAVLSIRAVSKGDTTVTQEGQSSVYGTAMNVGGTVLAGARDYSLATLQTNLYDSATAGLVWTATVKTNDAGRAARVSRELARFFLEQLRKDGFL
jgi:hypothetical protein